MAVQMTFIAAAIALVPLLGASATVIHYPPNATNINNLTFVLNGTGAPGIFNSSITPDNVYGEYNWCNMPHVRTREYKTPSSDYTLEYVEVIQRHHKRTPYSSNTFFKEDIPWSCEGQGPEYGLRTASGSGADVPDIQWQATTNPLNPWTNTIGPGFVNSTCQFPQITDQGLADAMTHGEDLRAVYASRLGLSTILDPTITTIRVTNNQITSQVASGLVKGLFPSTTDAQVLIQSDTYDSLEPAYSCSAANALSSAITGNQTWIDHLTDAAGVYAQLDAISGISNPDNGGWHVSFDHYYDNLSAKQCHGKPLPCDLNSTSTCVSQELADTVYRLGNWEYSWQFRDAPQSAQYSTLHYGAWVLELQGHLQDIISGQSKARPSQLIVVFELYSETSRSQDKSSSNSKQTPSYFLRVLWGGQPMQTSTPLGTLDMIPVDDFFSCMPISPD
ncbi:hypothetical protein H0H92_007223 [Tricholoma furcatifolium]|nr:hypothetical protein H0H92_007223 [Tricholoma furcatifolium]